MAHLLRVPEIAAGTTEAVLAAWPVAENSAYSATDVIATVETDKAVVDIEAENSGIMLRRLVAEGAVVAVGQPIALIGQPGESAENIDEQLRAQGLAAPVSSSATSPAEPPATPDAAAPVAAPADPAAAPAAPERIFISPLARRLARDSGLAPRDIQGTGPNGRILRRDVERAARARTAEESRLPSHAPAAVRPGTGPAGYTDVPHSRLRRAVASRLTESKQTVPHFYLSATIRAGRLLRLRAELNEGGGEVRISVNDLLIKAVAHAHQLVPAMNVIWTPDAITVVRDRRHRSRNRQLPRPGDAGTPLGGQHRDHGDLSGRPGPGRPGRIGTAPAAGAGRRHDHRHQPGHVRHRAVRRHHQPAPVGDSRRRSGAERAGRQEGQGRRRIGTARQRSRSITGSWTAAPQRSGCRAVPR